MVKQIINIAENAGNMIANFNFSNLLKVLSKPDNQVLYQIKPFRQNEFGLPYWQGFLSNFTNLSDEIDIFIIGNSKEIKIYARLSEKLKKYFENTFYANFPSSDLILVEGEDIDFKGKYVFFENANIKVDDEFKKDGSYLNPMRDLISLFYDINYLDGNVRIFYKYKFKIKKNIFSQFMDFFKIFSNKTTSDSQESNESKTKNLDLYNLLIGFEVRSSDLVTISQLNENIKNTYEKFKSMGKVIIKNKPKYNQLNMNQLVNFFHIPTQEYYFKNLNYLTYRKLPFPPHIPTRDNTEKNGLTLLGDTDFKNEVIRFGIKNEDKFRHMYIIGKTGVGKSTLISNMALSDMITNKGMALIDPHGDLVETVLEHVPPWRTNDIVLFDVADLNHPIGFNILSYDNEEQKNLVASGIVGIFKKLYGHSWGPRLEYILRNVLLSVIEYPDATLMHLTRMLTDKNFRLEVLSYVKDPIVLKFWNDEFNKMQDKQLQEAISPIVNKVGQFLSSSIVRNIFGQPRSRLNIRKIMDEGKILLINLSKGRIGEDNAEMIGSFIVTKFQIDAMSRADISHEKDRRDFFLYIDEFQNFATESFESILSEARKYRLSLIVANQYISQLDEGIKNAIFGNVGTIISFALGHDDATVMSSQYKGLISANDLLSLPKFRAYIKLMMNGITADPFCMATYPLPTPMLADEIKEKIRKQSRQRYGIEKERLETLIKIWAEKKFSPVEKVMEKALQDSKSGEKAIQEDNINSNFTIKDVEIGKWYKGLVKLKYNYGLFVTVKGVEGLLHKNFLDVPLGVRWKDLYDIGSEIDVKALEFKEINGENRVVWGQLSNSRI